MLKLMIIDDEVELIKGVKTVINWEENDIQICGEASDGLTALKLIENLKPHIILLDIKMPLMDGLELLERINNKNIKVKTIILSGYDNFYYAKKAMHLYATDYLLKPCRPKEILQAVLKAKSILEKENSLINRLDEYESQFKLINDLSENKSNNSIVRSVVQYIEVNYNKNINLKSVADQVYITSNYLSLLFKNEMGINFIDYLHQYRITEAKKLLTSTNHKNYQISYSVGYNDVKYFSQIFKKYTGMTPSQYRNNVFPK